MASVYDLIPEFTLYKHCMADEDRNFKMNVNYSIHTFSLMSNGEIQEVDDGKCIHLVDNYEKYLIYKDGEAVHYNKQLCFEEFLSPHNIEEYTRLYECIEFNLLERAASLSKEEKQKLSAYFSYVSLQFESWFQLRKLKLPKELKTKLHNLLSDKSESQLIKWTGTKWEFSSKCLDEYNNNSSSYKNETDCVRQTHSKYDFDPPWPIEKALQNYFTTKSNHNLKKP